MIVPFVFVGAVLSSRECRLLRNAASVAGWETATILHGSKSVLNKRVRNARVSRLEAPSNEISAIIEKIISTARWISESAFNISITQPEAVLRIVRYETGGKYKWHVDHGRGIAARRKISIVVQLSAEKGQSMLCSLFFRESVIRACCGSVIQQNRIASCFTTCANLSDGEAQGCFS